MSAVAVQARTDEVSLSDTLSMSLDQCLDMALGYNYTKQSVVLDEDTRQADVKQSKMEFAPDISANLSENVSRTNADGTNWNGSYDLSASMTLFQGGELLTTLKQNKMIYEQTRLQTQQYNNELTISVLESFLTALGYEELLSYQETIAESSRQQAEEGKVKYEAGKILESDYLLLEAQYATDKDNVTTTRINLENTLVNLKNLMAMDLSQQIKLVSPDDAVLEAMLTIPTREEVVFRGMETMPEVKISDYNVQIAEKSVRIAKSGYYPTITLNGGIGTGHAVDFSRYGNQLSDRFGPQGGITVSIPIFNRNRTQTNVKQSKIALQQAELEYKQSIKDIEQTLINEYGEVLSTMSRYKASAIKENAYYSSFMAYTEKFKAGAITTVQLLQQQNDYISAVNDYVQNKYTFMLQRKILDVRIGEEVRM